MTVWLLGLLTPYATAVIFAIARLRTWKLRWLFHIGQIICAFVAGPLFWKLASVIGLKDYTGPDPGPITPFFGYLVLSVPGSLIVYLAALLLFNGNVKTTLGSGSQ